MPVYHHEYWFYYTITIAIVVKFVSIDVTAKLKLALKCIYPVFVRRHYWNYCANCHCLIYISNCLCNKNAVRLDIKIIMWTDCVGVWPKTELHQDLTDKTKENCFTMLFLSFNIVQWTNSVNIWAIPKTNSICRKYIVQFCTITPSDTSTIITMLLFNWYILLFFRNHKCAYRHCKQMNINWDISHYTFGISLQTTECNLQTIQTNHCTLNNTIAEHQNS